EIVQQDFDAGVRKRFPDQPDDAHAIFEILIRVIDDPFAVVLVEQTLIFLLFGRLEFFTHAVLLADKDELTRGGVIVVLQKVMHAEAKIVQIELAEVFARDREWIEVILLELASEFVTLLVFAPEKTGAEQNDRGDDRRENVDPNFPGESVHGVIMRRSHS